MKSLATVLIISGLFLGLAGNVLAEPKLDFGGQMRFRGQYDDRDLNPANVTLKYSELRTRVHLQTELEKNVIAYVQFQDSRVFGADTSGALNDKKNVDIHQAYIQINRLWHDGVGLKVGRFEVNIGNQRVFGAVDWSNVGRAWDGGMLWYDQLDFRLNGYWLKRLELNDTLENRDFDITGLNAIFKDINLELFGFYEHSADNLNAARQTTRYNKLNRFNIGLYHSGVRDEVDYEVTAVYQSGDQADPTAATPANIDISAVMIQGEAGYTFEERDNNLRLAFGLDYTSGDDRQGDLTNNAYDNLYYTGHKFRGYMDYFVDSPYYGLLDVVFRASLDPYPMWTVKGDMHFFKATADYVDFVGNDTRKIGSELDLTAVTTSVPGIVLTGGASVFLPSEAFAGYYDPPAMYWAYLMAEVNF